MPKFYVESGPIRLISDAATAEQAAAVVFQWSCDKQVEIQADSPLDHMLAAEDRGWQLWDEISVNEQGFGSGSTGAPQRAASASAFPLAHPVR